LPITASRVRSRRSPNCVNLQKNSRPDPPIDSNHFVARVWWTWRSIVRAIQTLMSGKRNEVVDFGIVEMERPGFLRWHEWKFDPPATLPSRLFQDLLHTPQNQFFCGSAFARSARFKPAVNRVRNVHRGSHRQMLPYLWLSAKRQPSLVQMSCGAGFNLRTLDLARTKRHRLPFAGKQKL
jgi:hypothetical protein